MLFSLGSILSRLFGQSDRYTYGDFSDVSPVEAVAGTFLLVSKERFKLVGGFDERFFMYMEDTDLSHRMRLQNFRNYIDPAAGGIHHWGRGSTARESTRMRYHHTSISRYAGKYFSILSRTLLRVMLTLNLGIRLVITRRREQR